jgi:hypothetical protein
VPDAVLSQLGLKIQHALRAFTAKDRKAIKLTAENYPLSDYYDTKEVLTKLGIGEALVTALNEKGIPTPLAATMLRAPMSRMDILEDNELKDLIKTSKLIPKYNEEVDRESAYEMLSEKIEQADAKEARAKAKKEIADVKRSSSGRSTSSRSRSTRTKQNPFIKTLTSPTVIRSVLGILTKLMR